MKLYVKARSSYRSDLEEISIKKELKQKYKLDTRRKDDFIHAGILGALRLQEQSEVHSCDELYLTSGVGNCNIVQTAKESVYDNKEIMKLFDFINILGNTTSFYVAKALGITAKSLFQISDNFTYFHSLINIYASLQHSKNEAVFGAIDVVSEDISIIKRVLGVEASVSVVSSVCYQKLSLQNKDAQAELEFDTIFYSLDEVLAIIKEEDIQVICSQRCRALEGVKPLVFFETYGASVVNELIEKQENALFIECYNEKYKILKIRAKV